MHHGMRKPGQLGERAGLSKLPGPRVGAELSNGAEYPPRMKPRHSGRSGEGDPRTRRAGSRGTAPIAAQGRAHIKCSRGNGAISIGFDGGEATATVGSRKRPGPLRGRGPRQSDPGQSAR